MSPQMNTVPGGATTGAEVLKLGRVGVLLCSVWLGFDSFDRRNVGIPDRLKGIPGSGNSWARKGVGNHEGCSVD